ncbi:helix-turn-helix domain-containing protein [Alkalicoccobacillus porphyridii]|uniref:Helix-turn-helix transcriptional regulator n=1 Tax=Alkalicoccobacillus porphyridii TaxID=2597270 RepID=A0A553ZVC1_9BACI|nr:helix-turn-helix transcriptional regulator [Alkalicoccobacillus porphyridii]TSB45430.1 helix-turn-helix transcriptional regulator [Alkalicoccobacillus porphyridii]
MHEGFIIKYYREQQHLTQQQLSKGICSVAHISRIERGTAHYSTEITYLLSNRLGVDIEHEVKKFKKVKETLDQWHVSMIMQDRTKTESYKEVLEKNTLLLQSTLGFYYQLLLVRYYLTKQHLKEAERELKQISTKNHLLSDRDIQLYYHMCGIHRLFTGEYEKALGYFKQIEPEVYRNDEYYYHLAITCYRFGHHVKAYEYARMSLNFFKQANHFRKIIDAETLILLTQSVQIVHHDLDELVDKYNDLIRSCDLFGEYEKKAILLNNLGYEYFLQSMNREANNYYKESLELYQKCNYPNYISPYAGYILTSYLLKDVESDQQLMKSVRDVMQLAKQIGNIGDTKKIKLLSYLIKGQMKQYYAYLHESLIPYLRKSGNVTLASYYEKQLFNHYIEANEGEKATQVAYSYIKGS